MPANLSADFIKARERFKSATVDEERLDALQEMLITIPKHKGTEKMQADIKRRIANLKKQGEKSKKGRSSSGPERIDREGAGQVVLIGPPNTGKSSLLSYLTNAKPKVADYPFSSTLPVPGMMAYQDIAIQIIDLPPISVEYTEPWVYNIVRNADLAIIVVAVTADEDSEDIAAGIRLVIEQLSLRHTLLVRKRSDTIDWRTAEVPAQIVINKCDLAGERYVADVADKLTLFFPVLPVSTISGMGMDKLPATIFTALNIVRIYTKLPGKDPDLTAPYSLPVGSVVLDAVNAVHREFSTRLKFVRIWGSGKFDGQKIPTDHILQDGDIVEIHC